jgi:cation diffusion facilitator CzcD-associated flavoprotein CzcO
MGSIEPPQPDYDVLVIGAGLSGCYACYKMRELGVKVKVLEAGTSVGGTWYWSRLRLSCIMPCTILSKMTSNRLRSISGRSI